MAERTIILRPNGAGAETTIPQQVPSSGYHWDKVDEETADDATTYIRTQGSNTQNWYRDLFTIQTPSSYSGAISKIVVYARAGNTASNQIGIFNISIRTNNTTVDSADVPITYGWRDESYTWTINPVTSQNWTWDNILSLQIGCKMKDFSGFVVQCTQMYVVVYYNVSDIFFHNFL